MLVPVLDQTIPTSRDQFARLVRMPECGYADTFVRLPLLVQLGRLPIPDIRFAIAVAGHQITIKSNQRTKSVSEIAISTSNSPHVRREIHAARIAGHHMAGERLLAIHLEAIERRKDDDLVVQTLAGQPFAVRRQCDGRHRVHRRIGNVLDVDRNVPLPDAHRFVVGRRDEPTVLVDERDRVDGAQMPIVLLDDVTASDVPLGDWIIFG